MQTQTRSALVHDMAPYSIGDTRRASFGLDTVENCPFGSVEVMVTPKNDKAFDKASELPKYRVTVLVEKIAD